MKPYILAGYNWIRFHLLKLRYGHISLRGIQLFNSNTRIVIQKGATIFFGDRIISDGRCSIIVGKKGKLQIEGHTYFNENMMISCKERIVIGESCRFGPNVCIFDNNHIFNAEDGVKDEYKSSSIIIGDGCWIGAGAIILKGSQIGKHCVIGAGCVIQGVIPDCSIVKTSRKLEIEKII